MLIDEIKKLRNCINHGAVLPQDRVKLNYRLKKILSIKNEEKQRSLFGQLKEGVLTAKTKKEMHLLRLEKINYPSDLPITSKVNEIKKLIDNNQVIIVSGATGSGKTTQLPKILLDMGLAENGVIGCTQPRRIAATGMAKRVASELGVKYGNAVGCQIRFDKNVGDDTLIKFMTDGILLSETAKDKLLLQYSAIIIDEVHERSLNIDFILGYLKNLINRRPELKIIISSATLDAGAFSDFFKDAPIVEVEGKLYPIEDLFLPAYEDEDISKHCCRAVEWISELDSDGDILIFMPGEREIRAVSDLLKGRRFKNTQVFPLYGRISIAEQNRVFDRSSQRRIIVSTNVAETSITIPGIHYVIDSGLARVNRYNPKTQIQMLQVEQISKASARQRRGRCGRIAEGVCVYLYDKEVLENAPDYTDPEICRTSLSGVILQMNILNLPDIEDFPFLDKPALSLVREGKKGLREIGALNRANELTEEGRAIAKFPIEPRFAKMLCEGYRQKVLPETLAAVSYLSLQDPRERPEDKRQAADQSHAKWKSKISDFDSILNLWNFIAEQMREGVSNTKLRNICKKEFLNYRRVREWFNLYQDLCRIVRELKWNSKLAIRVFDDYNYDFLHMSILAGFPMNIGFKKEDNSYQGTNNRKFFIFPGSGIFKTVPKWVMAFPFVETSRTFGRNAAEINCEWLETIAPQLCRKKYYDIHWDSSKGFVFALESIFFAGIEIKSGARIHYGKIDPVKSREIFIRDGMVYGNMYLRNRWVKRHRKLIDDIKLMEIKKRIPDALFDKESVFKFFEKAVPKDIFSAKSLDRWLHKSRVSIDMTFEDALYPQLSEIKTEDYPDYFILNNEKFPIEYSFSPGEKEDGATLVVSESKIAFIPEWLSDWIVPGWLVEKVERVFKSLPKDIRVKMFPIKKTVSGFIEQINSNPLLCKQFLLLAVIEYLRDEYSITCGVGDFDLDSIPEYLTLNIAVIDDETGKIKSIGRGLGEIDVKELNEHYSSVVSMEKWTRSGLTQWPDFDIPDSVELSSEPVMIGYPAVVDEGETVGVKIFLDEDEAFYNHIYGVTALFRINFMEQFNFIEKKIAIGRNLALSLSSIYSSNKYKRDIVEAAVGRLITDREFRFIKSAREFDEQCENVLGDLYTEIEKNIVVLGKVFSERDAIMLLLIKQSKMYEEIRKDINFQIEALLSKGFLKWTGTYSKTLRYLQALKIRIQRLGFSTEKDFNKFVEIRKYQEIIADNFCLESENNFSSFKLINAFSALQEYRIKVFAPELKPFENINVKKLDDRFKKFFLTQ